MMDRPELYIMSRTELEEQLHDLMITGSAGPDDTTAVAIVPTHLLEGMLDLVASLRSLVTTLREYRREEASKNPVSYNLHNMSWLSMSTLQQALDMAIMFLPSECDEMKEAKNLAVLIDKLMKGQ